MRSVFAAGLALALVLPTTTTFAQAGKAPAPAASAGPHMVIETAKGVIEIEFSNDAPKSVDHIVELAKKGFYRGQRFHWVKDGVAQAGDRIFLLTDNAHLIAVSKANGELLWETTMADSDG